MGKKRIITFLSVMMLIIVSFSGCTSEKKEAGSSGKVDSVKEEAAEKASEPDTGSEDKKNDKKIEDEEALSGVRNYCYSSNSDLKEIEKKGEYPVYWNIESSNEDEIVVLFRSYTGAEIKYYIDRDSGDTHVTEFVQGITPEEEATNESFNIRDYFS